MNAILRAVGWRTAGRASRPTGPVTIAVVSPGIRVSDVKIPPPDVRDEAVAGRADERRECLRWFDGS